jgi:hypothetical protein
MTFKLVMNIGPNLAPWLVRPFVRYIANSFAAAAVDPSIEAAIDMVIFLELSLLVDKILYLPDTRYRP